MFKDDEIVRMVSYANSIPEKNKRHFLAILYLGMVKRNQSYISKIFSCSRTTIKKGVLELAEITSSGTVIDYSRQRKSGGGRKKKNK